MEDKPQDPRRIPLQIELEPGADPISGRLTGPDGVGVEFVGWLGLSTVLERLTQTGGRGPTGGRPASP